MMNKEEHFFVELDKNAHWFIKAVAGPKGRKGDLKAVEVQLLLRDKLNQKLDEQVRIEEAGGETQSTADSQDPMDALDDIAKTRPLLTPPKNKGTARNARSLLDRSKIYAIKVPVIPVCAGGDATDTVDVWICKSSKETKLNLSLRSDCIPWLLAYACDEYTSQGVPESSPVPPSESVANCTAVADLHVSWDFLSRGWIGKFIAGPLAGTQKQLLVSEMNQNMWTHLGRSCLYASGFQERKDASKEWLISWCAAVLRDEAHDFESAMDACTPPPKRRRKEVDAEADESGDDEDDKDDGDDDDSAVAADTAVAAE